MSSNSANQIARVGRNSIARPMIVAFGIVLLVLLIAAVASGIMLKKLKQPVAYANNAGLSVAVSLREMHDVVDRITSSLSQPRDPLAGPAAQQDVPEQIDAQMAIIERLLTNLESNELRSLPLDSLQASHERLVKQVATTLAALADTTTSSNRTQSLRGRIETAASAGRELTRHYNAQTAAGSGIPATLLSDLLYEWSQVLSATSAAAESVDEDAIAVDSNQFAAALRRLVRGVARLPEHEGRAALFDSAQVLFDVGRSDPSYFEEMRALVAQRSALSIERDRLQTVTEDMRRQIKALATANDATIGRTLGAAALSLDRYQFMLVGSLIAAALAGAVIIRRYVFKGVINRLRKLHTTTLWLAAGDLKRNVHIEGDDEITDLARALEGFRDNALARAQSEQILKTRTKQLEEVNRELDDFAYVASHDLRAPLHGVDSLASFMQEDLADQLPDESKRHLELMRARIQRLHNLLDALLQFSRVGRENVVAKPVNLRDLIASCVALFETGELRIEQDVSDEVVKLQAQPFEQVVRNLLDNAIKHHDREEGLIEIHARCEDGYVLLSVADDGPGIAPQFHDRIFGMFQTLQARDTTEGSGIGLTFLRKSVNHIGGTIEVRSDPARGRGTMFVVTWPVA